MDSVPAANENFRSEFLKRIRRQPTPADLILNGIRQRIVEPSVSGIDFTVAATTGEMFITGALVSNNYQAAAERRRPDRRTDREGTLHDRHGVHHHPHRQGPRPH